MLKQGLFGLKYCDVWILSLHLGRDWEDFRNIEVSIVNHDMAFKQCDIISRPHLAALTGSGHVFLFFLYNYFSLIRHWDILLYQSKLSMCQSFHLIPRQSQAYSAVTLVYILIYNNNPPTDIMNGIALWWHTDSEIFSGEKWVSHTRGCVCVFAWKCCWLSADRCNWRRGNRSRSENLLVSMEMMI